MDSRAQLVVRDQENFLFLETPSKKLLLPYTRVKADEDFAAAAQRCITEILCMNCRLQGVIKIQHQTGKIVRQTEKLVVTFLAEKLVGRANLGAPSVAVKWVPLSELRGLSSFVVDPAVRLLVQSVHNGGAIYPVSLVECLDLQGARKSGGGTMRRRESEMGVGREGETGGKEEVPLEDQMLEQSGYTSHELSQISEEYVERCGGEGETMTEEQFSGLLTSLGYPPERCPQCFRALTGSPDSKQISLKELTVGLCALDPSTPHGGLSAQFRCQFIFAFYNTSCTGTLSFSEFRETVRDICTGKRVELSEEELDQSVQDNWKIFEVPRDEGVPLARFLYVVGQLKFRGTSVLFRLPRPPVVRTSKTAQSRVRELSPGPGVVTPNSGVNTPHSGVHHGVTTPSSGDQQGDKSPVTEKKVSFAGLDPTVEEEEEEGRGGRGEEMDVGRGREEVDGGKREGEEVMNVDPNETLPVGMPAMKVKREEESKEDDALRALSGLEGDGYSIATHFVKVRRSGAVADVTTLWDLVGTEMVSGSLDNVLSSRPGFDRLPSINAFDKQSKSNEMLSGLRYFEHTLRDNGRGQPKPAFSWGAVDMESVARCFMDLCSKAVDIFSSEPRLLEVKSPTYVLGDLHGNFHDLICFEKVLWRMGPVLTPASFLFLGDYVDRGPYGFEVVAYLFAQKLLMPSKFLLIRGNHEIRAVQETFSYKTECIQKFGPELGLEVWEATNRAFDTMPIAAVIDKKVFCVHGGIPLPTLGEGLISSIADVPVTLSDPMEESLLAWDIMWNDPIRSSEIDDVIEQQLDDNCGFIENFARGTAHMFNSTALDEFLKRNGLSHVIRAHECMAAGFQLQQNGRLLTVFSSSHYCGATNEAACVLVHNWKIRTIRLDTT